MKKYIEYSELKKQILSIKNLRDRAFFSLVYGSAGRIGEVVRHKEDIRGKEPYINPPIHYKNIKIIKDMKTQEKVVVVTVLTEKINQMRRVPIFPKYEYWLIKPILEWRKNHKDRYLFNYSTRWGQYLFKKYFGSDHIHLLRHWRITHLLNGSVTGSPIEARIVLRIAGHKSLSTQTIYDHSIIEDYIPNLLGGKKNE